MSRRHVKSGVKSHGLPVKLLPKLASLSEGEDSGIPGVAVECVDIGKNTRGEGGYLDLN